MGKRKTYHTEDPGEFLWLMSLSDLMILLFIFFVTLYSFAFKKLSQSDFNQILEAFGNKAETPIDKVENDVKVWLEENKLSDQVSIERKDGQIHIRMKDKLLFTSGDYKLLTDGARVVTAISKALDQVPAPYKIGIDGHTDDIPMKSKEIANNRELSAKRATAVFNSLSLSGDTQQRVIISALGETQPMLPNRSEQGVPIPENQAQNRRVTIRIY